MKVLYCHNLYQQAGGEDNCANDEVALLESHGHHVVRYTRHNDEIHTIGRFAAAGKTLWNRQTAQEIAALIREHQFDVMHCMNTFPLISPAVYYVAQRMGVAVVQSLQNYRLLCPGAYLMRDHQLCLDCVEKFFPWPAVQHGCYRGSRLGSLVLSSMLVTHRVLKTWQRKVDRYIACSYVGKETFVRGGLPAEKIAVKPNFIHPVPDPGLGAGGYMLFVGRLSPEKGITTMLDAWRTLGPAAPPLKILGDGPLRSVVEQAVQEQPRIEWLGWKAHGEVTTIMQQAAALILPSLWYEGFPKTLLESVAVGTPVLASNLGSMSETIRPGINGDLYMPGDVQGMCDVVTRFQGTSHREHLRQTTRADFLEHYTLERNYEQLMDIYRAALTARHGDSPPSIPAPHRRPTASRSATVKSR